MHESSISKYLSKQRYTRKEIEIIMIIIKIILIYLAISLSVSILFYAFVMLAYFFRKGRLIRQINKNEKKIMKLKQKKQYLSEQTAKKESSIGVNINDRR